MLCEAINIANVDCIIYRDTSGVRHCLQMSVYPATLQHIPIPMEESVVSIHGRQLRATLQNLHRRNYGHNDIKAANVCISATGEGQLTTYCCSSSLCVLCLGNLGYQPLHSLLVPFVHSVPLWVLCMQVIAY